MVRDDRESPSTDSLTRNLKKNSRRGFLALTSGSLAAMAGCASGDDSEDTPTTDGTPTTAEDTSPTSDSTPTNTPTTGRSGLEQVDQTLRLNTQMNPADVTFMATGALPKPKFGTEQEYIFGADYWPVMHDAGAFGPWSNSGIRSAEQITYTLLESAELSENELILNIRDDATWSNGNPITGKDFIVQILGFRLFSNASSPETVEERGDPDAGPTGYRLPDEKTAVLEQTATRFPDDKPGILSGVLGWTAFGGLHADTSIDPYSGWADLILEEFEKAMDGETDPWNVKEERAFPKFRAYWTEKDTDWGEYFRQPENVHTSGAFTLKEINGTQSIVLEKNPEHVFADKVNFDEVVIETRAEKRAVWSSLRANRLDLYQRGTTPQNVVNSFPDDIQTYTAPSSGGTVIALNHADDKPLSDPKVRQALMQVLDTERIANTLHGGDVHAPVKVVGAHPWGLRDIVGDDFVEENLHDYSSDTELASDLLRQAGWSRDGGAWMDEDGESVSLRIPTKSDTPKMPVSVAEQLDQFGIDTAVQTLGTEQYNQSRDNGEFTLMASESWNFGVGYPAWALGRSLYALFTTIESWTARYNIHDKEDVKAVSYAGEEENLDDSLDGGIVNPATIENFSKLKIDAPEIGDWEAENGLTEWSPAGLGWEAWGTSDDELYAENMKKLAWIVNWHMPVLPLTQKRQQHLMDRGHWIWPEESWMENAGVGFNTEFTVKSLVGHGYTSADPENPE